jgi:hypothetical protein
VRPPDDARPGATAPGRSLGAAIRGAFASYIDELVLFSALNLGLVLSVAVVTAAASIVPPLIVGVPLLALPTAVLTRLAVVAARDGTPRWAMIGEELGRRAGRKLLLATLQLLVIALGVGNVTLAPEIGGLAGWLSGLVAAYALIAVSLYAVALWPIVCDPLRDGPLRQQLRLAASVLLVRPLQVFVLAVIAVLAMVASVQLIAPALILPALVLLAIAAYVVDVADRLRPLED